MSSLSKGPVILSMGTVIKCGQFSQKNPQCLFLINFSFLNPEIEFPLWFSLELKLSWSQFVVFVCVFFLSFITVLCNSWLPAEIAYLLRLLNVLRNDKELPCQGQLPLQLIRMICLFKFSEVIPDLVSSTADYFLTWMLLINQWRPGDCTGENWANEGKGGTEYLIYPIQK